MQEFEADGGQGGGQLDKLWTSTTKKHTDTEMTLLNVLTKVSRTQPIESENIF